MSLRNRLSLALAVCGLMACLPWCYCEEVVSKKRSESESGGVNVVLLSDRSVLLGGKFDLICTAEQATLRVDQRPQRWEPFEPPLRVWRLNLPPGLHALKIGSRPLEVFVADKVDHAGEHGGPEGWEVCRSHPIKGQGADRCGACHEIQQRDGRTSVGRLKSYQACFECHRSVDFDVTHSHPLEPIEHCQMCHQLHGSPRKALLKAPVKQLCAECHES